MKNFNPCEAVSKSIIFVKGVLNIFTDASIIPLKKKATWNACSGAIGINSDLGVNLELGIIDDCTNNIAELTGIELGVEMAIKQQYNFKRINLFSDSRISVFSLREWFFNWVKNAGSSCDDYGLHLANLKTSSGSNVKNYSIIMEIINKISNIDPKYCQFNIYHCPGHMHGKTKEVIKLFDKHNKILLSEEDANLLTYYNDKIDNLTRVVIKDYQANQENHGYENYKRQILPFSVIPLQIDNYKKIIGAREF